MLIRKSFRKVRRRPIGRSACFSEPTTTRPEKINKAQVTNHIMNPFLASIEELFITTETITFSEPFSKPMQGTKD